MGLVAKNQVQIYDLEQFHQIHSGMLRLIEKKNIS